MYTKFNDFINESKNSEFDQAIKDISPLIAELVHDRSHHSNKEGDSFDEILQKVKEGDDKTLDELWKIAGSELLKYAIDVITHYTKK